MTGKPWLRLENRLAVSQNKASPDSGGAPLATVGLLTSVGGVAGPNRPKGSRMTAQVCSLKGSPRSRRRGAVLVVILGLLVVLALIAIAFGFIVTAEYDSSISALDRFRARSAARDGEAYAVAYLRAVAQTKHYEAEGAWTFNARFTGPEKTTRTGPRGTSESYENYLLRYSRNPGLSQTNQEILVSLSKLNSTSNTAGQADANWVDRNGDGVADESERNLARDIINLNQNGLRNVSYFVGDGIDLRVRESKVRSGSRRELGDRARLKIIDTNSQFPINSYAGEQLVYMLRVLGDEIAKATGGEHNPFPTDVARQIAQYQEEQFGRIGSKQDIVQFMKPSIPPHIEEFTLDLIAVQTWPLVDSAISGTVPLFTADRFPDPNKPITEERARNWRRPDTVHRDKLGKSGIDQSYDGMPHIDPSGGRVVRAPININTVSRPVLATMLAGIEAEPRFLWYPKSDRVMSSDGWADLMGYTNARRLNDPTQTTDAGRQPLASEDKGNWLSQDPGANNATYQVITVGPLAHAMRPDWTDTATQVGGGQMRWEGFHASNLAARIIKDREDNGPYRSWQDFDWRVCHGILLGFAGGSQNATETPDLVNATRGSIGQQISVGNMPKGNGSGERHLLPDPAELRHPATLAHDTNHSYNAAEFQAWYWRACVDMIRSNFNPNGYYNKQNPDAPIYTVVDSTDMRYQTSPLCFSSMGVYEIVSQGEITAIRQTTSRVGNVIGDMALEYPVARRTFRSVVEVYQIMEHTTQSDFVRAPDKTSFGPQQPGSSQTVSAIAAPVSLAAMGTQVHPVSIDFGEYDFATRHYVANDQRMGTPRGLKSRTGTGSPEPLYGGYFASPAADNRFGWVSLYPQDRSPNRATMSNPDGLNFWAPYNVSLEGRPRVGLGPGNQHVEGHVPYSVAQGNPAGMTDALMSRSWSNATPDPNRLNWATQGWVGIELASSRMASESARYANLRPDGVRMTGWSLHPSFRPGNAMTPEFTHMLQDQITSRVAALIYRAGQANLSDTPFGPIANMNPSPSNEDVHGDDFWTAIVRRMTGANLADVQFSLLGGSQGTDRHNIMLQQTRQMNTNFPYYEGWIDFWIKWELPPQGRSGDTVAMAGEIDPGSGNFSGLIGATSYGRFESSLNTSSSNAGDGNGVLRANLSNNNDFEGAQFFVFKEPEGKIRVSHIYFNRAYTVSLSNWQREQGAIAARVQGGYDPTGSNARIYGQNSSGAVNSSGEALATHDEFAWTNDIASGYDENQNLDLGFSFARNESYFDLNNSGDQDVKLATHNWYRFSLKYVSNSRHSGGVDPARAEPHELYIDGRKVLRAGPALPSPLGTLDETSVRGINTGEITDIVGARVNANFDGTMATEFIVQRSATLLGEVDPGDKLTIGCVWRHMVGEQAQVNPGQTSFRLFRFDQNLIAPANATIDDVRIYHQLTGAAGFSGVISASEYAAFSRFQRVQGPTTDGQPSERAMYENGFVALQTTGGLTTPFTYPVRVGSLTWTDYRPVWDPYAGKRLDANEAAYANAPHVMIGYQVFDDITQMVDTGPIVAVLPDGAAMNSSDRNRPNYWANGGYSVSSLSPAGAPVYMSNVYTSQTNVTVSFFKYQAWFIDPNSRVPVLNTTPILDDVRITILTPARRIFEEEVFR